MRELSTDAALSTDLLATREGHDQKPVDNGASVEKPRRWRPRVEEG